MLQLSGVNADSVKGGGASIQWALLQAVVREAFLKMKGRWSPWAKSGLRPLIVGPALRLHFISCCSCCFWCLKSSPQSPLISVTAVIPWTLTAAHLRHSHCLSCQDFLSNWGSCSALWQVQLGSIGEPWPWGTVLYRERTGAGASMPLLSVIRRQDSGSRYVACLWNPWDLTDIPLVGF